MPTIFRPIHSRILLVGFVGMAAALSASRATAADPSLFLRTYCVDCHSGEEPDGERELEQLDLKRVDDDTMILLQDVIDQLTLGNMPPEDAEQPSAKERSAAIESITGALKVLRQQSQSTGRQTILRRLARDEYLNTVRDLFQMDVSMFDPTIRFPRDNTVEHLDNVGDALVTSAHLLEQYLEAADAIVEKALGQLDRPEERNWHFDSGFRQQPELDSAHREAFNYRYLCLYDSPLAEKPEGAYGPIHDFEEGVPLDGVYEIRVRAQALHRDTFYDPQQLRIDLDEPFRMGIRPGKASVGSMHNVQPIQPLLAETIVEDNELKWYTFQVPLDRGYSPRFTFENGLAAMRGLHTRLFRIYNDSFPEKVRSGKGIAANRRAMLRYGEMPQIRIHEIEIRGPIIQEWPSRQLLSVLPEGTFHSDDVQALVDRFARRAYRRPLREGELERLLAVYETRKGQGADAFTAFKDTLKVTLCSPSFLYLSPDCPPDSDRVSQHALAARLSYFLTGSTPDDELRSLADRGELTPEELVNQTRRLLASTSSETFVTRFVDAWLNLRDLGGMPPDRGDFWQFYSANLQPEMKQETALFLRHLIENDLPVSEWLTADYSFINRDLARLYGCVDEVPAEEAERFRKVSFADGRRGGLLGQASVLTVSANGIETSPVIRGVWMLENVLGTPPSPPPDDVPAIDPDVRGAKSIRDLLDKHRTQAACNECHRKIDPLGFAFENFDPIGRYRTHYENKVRIDASGKLPNGEAFDDVVRLRELLIEQKEFFVRAFAEKLVAFAIGRRIEPGDRAEIDEIINGIGEQNHPTRKLIEAIVTSELFASR